MLNENSFKKAADILKCDVPAIEAVNEIEASGSGFLKGGDKLKILFEGHQFWKALKRHGIDPAKYNEPGILYPKWDRSKYLGGEKEWDRLMAAAKINQEAAYESASWGAFQIMGFNYVSCGFKNVFDMVTFMQASEDNQLECFVRYLKAVGLDDELRAHDWARFAKGYNGPGYKGNPSTIKDDYDFKLKNAWVKFSGAAPTLPVSTEAKSVVKEFKITRGGKIAMVAISVSSNDKPKVQFLSNENLIVVSLL